MQQTEPFHIRSKIWIEDESGNVVFGLGRLKILDAIDRLGSIQGAAKELKMSYRAIWGRIKATEERLNRPLLIRNIGGRSGGRISADPFRIRPPDTLPPSSPPDHHPVRFRVRKNHDVLFREKQMILIQGC